MTILLDSALIEEARHAAALGFVHGITTNPTLLARVDAPARDVIPPLAATIEGVVFYQLTGATLEEKEAEAREALTWAPDRIGLKIPATTENMALVHLFAERAPVAVTAIFNGPQAIAACAAGARYLLPYVNRTTLLKGDGPAFVRLLRDIADASGAGTEILAASLKSGDEAVAAVLAGAQHLSMPLTVLRELGEDPLSREAIEAFRESAG